MSLLQITATDSIDEQDCSKEQHLSALTAIPNALNEEALGEGKQVGAAGLSTTPKMVSTSC